MNILFYLGYGLNTIKKINKLWQTILAGLNWIFNFLRLSAHKNFKLTDWAPIGKGDLNNSVAVVARML
jgi:hypothetical protein